MKHRGALVVAGLSTIVALTPPAQAAEQRTGAPGRTEAPFAGRADRLPRPGHEQKSKDILGVLDINRASADELRELPGIGAVQARTIMENRPYGGAEDLVKRRLVPQATYDRIKDHISAK